MIRVKKRNGSIVDYQKSKIVNAIAKACAEIYPEDTKTEEIVQVFQKVHEDITKDYDGESDYVIDIERIQDLVEDELLKVLPDVAKAYIKYRYKHQMARDGYDSLMNELNTKISGKNILNQNANIDEHSFGGRMGETSDLVAKRLALEFYVSPMARKNHEENMIYIHDLSAYCVGMHNCLSVPFDDLLRTGFNTRQTDVRPAQSINTAFQLVAVIFQLQSLNQFGGVSATHLDWTLVPYVRKSFFKHFRDGLKYIDVEWEDAEYSPELSIEADEYKAEKKAYYYAMDMTVKETYQAVEGMYHNLKIWA